MERASRVTPGGRLGITEDVQSDATLDVWLGAHAIDRFLHLATTTIAPLDGIGRGRQLAIIQKGEGFLQVG